MRKMGKYKRKKQKKIIIISSLSILLFLCVGYAAFNTQLTLKARGNIKQRQIGAKMLKENVVNNGDGLYKDIYEDNKYTYKGANPNNYIMFNGELWRIICINPDNTIKIIRSETIGQISFDTSKENDGMGSNEWDRPASLNIYLNNEYLNTIQKNKEKIVESIYSVGSVTYQDNNLSNQIADENSLKWTGKIALPTASEYIRASSNIESCGTWELVNNTAFNQDSACLNSNWMLQTYRSGFILLSPNNYIGDYSVLGTSKLGELYGDMAHTERNVVPVLTIDSKVILSGEGNIDNPYQIEN